MHTRTVRAVSAWAAGAVLTGLSAVVGCRAFGVDGVTPVPQALAFLPWLLVPAAVALALAALARWRPGLVWALVVLAVIGWFCRPYGAGSTGAEGPVVAPLRVLTANVEFGRGTDALVAAVLRDEPDLVFVQECEYACAGALTARVPSSAYPYRALPGAGGSRGSAILSRYPLRPTEGIDGAMEMPGAVVLVQGEAVRLQLAHPLPPIPRGVGAWREELGRLRNFAATARDEPLLLAGDFNASQDHAAFRAVLDAGGLHDSARLAGASRTPSWPADDRYPMGTQIDHVLVSDDFSVRSALFLGLAPSDHRALLVELDLHKGSRVARAPAAADAGGDGRS
ncbi:endonuclease/exonuclease/phosphatase family protein [Streptomyces sannanensis]|uniref:Endonuclease/exonuclease/phosphatase family protein n=1 Tax=Streptomyces sannanensis TaxID=285536 RepID=A0ABP6SD18_9ACTN